MNISYQIQYNNIITNLIDSNKSLEKSKHKDALWNELIALLTEHASEIDPTKSNYNVILMAVNDHKDELIEFLLNWKGLNGKRFDPTLDNNEALLTAAFKHNIDIVKLLLKDERIDLTNNHNRAILQALMNGQEKIVELYVKWYIDHGKIKVIEEFADYPIIKNILGTPKKRHKTNPPKQTTKKWFEVLGVSHDAQQNTVKKAYRELLLKWHPDKNPGNSKAIKKTQKIIQAYEEYKEIHNLKGGKMKRSNGKHSIKKRKHSIKKRKCSNGKRKHSNRKRKHSNRKRK